ncbi:FecR family protein [uncultured Draconibacterium sp.]|uniref:FecR family protein n=1 Tax=uncultured Draconibacterium sp. TaxID=1573823 RepID=UPI0029C6F029|nr:FecR family protein [uncultured Draconibacterium sp.]
MNRLFNKYYRSLLNPDEFSEVSEFFSEAKNETRIFNMMKPFWEEELTKSLDSKHSNSDLYSKIKEFVLLDKQKRLGRKIRFYTWSLRIAAVFIIGLLLSTVFLFQESRVQYSDQIQTITTPYGAKMNYTLPDGSIVWLNSGSTFSYAAKFGKTRSVTLDGEAFFKVVKDSKPFIVATNHGNVEVKGTSFNVKAYTDDNDFETTLVKGSVVFKVKNAGNEVTLKPGEQVSKTESGYTVKMVETKYFTSWKDGKLLFNREPFPSFIKKLERWYNVKIEYSDPKLNDLWYTGTIEMESISEVMEMISKAAPVSYHFNNKTRVFTINAK